MGKSSKKANVEVAAVPVKKGKRDPEDALEKVVSAKKQKVKAVVVVPKLEKNGKNSKKSSKAPPPKKKAESSSTEGTLSESEEEPMLPPKKALVKKASSSSSEASSSGLSVDDEPAVKKPSNVSKNGSVIALSKKGKPTSSTSSESDSPNEDEDNVPTSTKATSAATKNLTATTKATKKEESDDSSDSDSDNSESSEDDATEASKESSSSEEDSSDDESGSEDEQTMKTPKQGKDVKMKDVQSIDNVKHAKSPTTPAGNQNQGGSTTLFVGNLSYKISKDDVAEFFKDVGEIVDVRLGTASDGSFKGYGHVDFATPEEAQKALELNGQDLFGRAVRLDLAHTRGERSAFTPQSGNSYQKGGAGPKQTIFIRGFDKYANEDQIRSSLQEHFGSCGEINRISIPKDNETGAVKGFAYLDLSNEDSLNNALELNGSELGGCALIVEAAKPRFDGGQDGGRGGGGRRGGGGGRRGGGRFGGRGGHGRGGRDGGRGRGGRRGGRGRGGGNSF